MMPSLKPVRRSDAAYYILLTLISFGLSVSGTRLYLELTGYPQIGNDVLHIAHALWGGLLLFIAALLPLFFLNRWTYEWSAILTGIGVGLFIDEVGKFITQTNDYFFPFAAPIIYAFFLVTVLVYLQAQRPFSRSPRTEMYRVFETMAEVIDDDLDSAERAHLEQQLVRIANQTERPDLALLAKTLQEFLRSEALRLVPHKPTLRQRITTGARDVIDRRMGALWLRRCLLLSFGLLALGGIGSLLLSISLFIAPEDIGRFIVENERFVQGANSLTLYLVSTILEAVITILFILATILLMRRNDQTATQIGTWGLLLSLTVVNLLLFYYDQFAGIVPTIILLLIYVALGHYRRYYLGNARSVWGLGLFNLRQR